MKTTSVVGGLSLNKYSVVAIEYISSGTTGMNIRYVIISNVKSSMFSLNDSPGLLSMSKHNGDFFFFVFSLRNNRISPAGTNMKKKKIKAGMNDTGRDSDIFFI